MPNNPKVTELALMLDRIAESVESWNDCQEDGDRGRGNDLLIMVLDEEGSGVFATSFYPPSFVLTDFPTYDQRMNVQRRFENTLEAAEYLAQYYDAASGETRNQTPIDMVIFCPNCHMQHIDRADRVCGSKVFDLTCRRPRHHTGPCSTADEKAAWSNPSHKSHTCRKDDGGCGEIFRIADVPTNGVKQIKTKGEKDTWAIHVQSTGD